MAQQIEASIEINGQTISPFSRLTISQRIDWHHHFEVIIALDAFQGTNQSVLNQAKEFIGTEAVITLKPKLFALGQTQNVFKGLVTEVSMARHLRGQREVIVRGQSPTILLDGALHCQSFIEMSPADMVQLTLDNIPANVLETQVNASFTDSVAYFIQYKESNFHFLNRIAALYGEWCFYNGTKLIYGKLPTDQEVNLPMDKDLFDFGFSLNLVPLSFTAMSYHYPDNETFESSSSDVQVDDMEQYGKFSLQKSEEFFKQKSSYASVKTIQNQGELDKLVAREKHALSRALVVASGISDNPFINVGSIVNITGEGIQEEDYGKFIITGVTHSTDGTGNYQNQFEAIPSEASSPPSNPNIRNPVPEIQPAVVMDNNDPDRLGRVKVKFMWDKDGTETPWLRIVNPHAGNGGNGMHGFYFIPEVDDEVLLGFEDNNPNKPFVFGSVYHGNSSPDAWSDQDNKVKVIKTRNGNHIQFTDEEGKEEIRVFNKDAGSATNEISLSMEGGGKITIKTEGELVFSAKSIKMNAEQGIHVESGKETTFKAKEMKIDAGSSFNLEGQEVKVDANNTSLKSKMSATLEGNASVEVKASGQTTIKGAMIMLN